MSTFVQECRREWKRLRVPKSVADEMAAELEADLAEAHADGVPEAEFLGETDPKRLARNWAVERGLIPAEPPPRRRRWVWILVGAALGLAVFSGLLISFVLVGTGSGTSVSVQGRVHPVMPVAATVPNLVGMKTCDAVLKANRAGLDVHAPNSSCDAIVASQKPAPGQVVRLNARHGFVTLRLQQG